MKVFIYVLMVIALGLLIYNASILDFDNLFEGESSIAAIGVVAPACVILLLLVLLTSLKIKRKSK